MALPKDCCLSCIKYEDRKGCTLWYHNYPIINKAAKIKDPEDSFTSAIPQFKAFIDNLEKVIRKSILIRLLIKLSADNFFIEEFYDQTYVGLTADGKISSGSFLKSVWGY